MKQIKKDIKKKYHIVNYILGFTNLQYKILSYKIFFFNFWITRMSVNKQLTMKILSSLKQLIAECEM